MFSQALDQSLNVLSFLPQEDEHWDSLHISTKMNVTFVFADSIEELEREYNKIVNELNQIV